MTVDRVPPHAMRSSDTRPGPPARPSRTRRNAATGPASGIDLAPTLEQVDGHIEFVEGLIARGLMPGSRTERARRVLGQKAEKITTANGEALARIRDDFAEEYAAVARLERRSPGEG